MQDVFQQIPTATEDKKVFRFAWFTRKLPSMWTPGKPLEQVSDSPDLQVGKNVGRTRKRTQMRKNQNAANLRNAVSVIKGANRRARSLSQSDAIRTSQDFANFMSAMIGDIVNGRIDIRAANAACNAGGKLLKVVEMEHKYSKRQDHKALTLSSAAA